MRDLPYDSHREGVSPSAPTTCGWVQTPPFFVNRPKSQGGTSEDRVATMSERS